MTETKSKAIRIRVTHRGVFSGFMRKGKKVIDEVPVGTVLTFQTEVPACYAGRHEVIDEAGNAILNDADDADDADDDGKADTKAKK